MGYTVSQKSLLIDIRYKICLFGRKHRSEQLMGDLPSVRSTDLLPAWAAVNMDLFGPILIRDECVKRGPRVVKKVWGIIYCCTLREAYIWILQQIILWNLFYTQ